MYCRHSGGACPGMIETGGRNPGFEKASAVRPILDASFCWHDGIAICS
jgi:hypothetical protein